MPAPIISHQEIVAGDDFKAAEGRALVWSSPQWPNLAGAALKMVVGLNPPSAYTLTPVTWTGSVPAGLPVFIATMEPTHTQTSALAAGCYDYTLSATLPNGDVVTLATGPITVLAEPGSPQLLPLP
jgi:hypothetical protein